jgi:Protein kinase domain
VEEIEATRVRVDAAPVANLSIAMKTAFGGGHNDTAEDMVQSIESLPPDEVKRRLVSALKMDASVQNESLDRKATSKGVDDLLKELCKVPASKEWEIDIYELKFLKRIGQGSAGTTYLADWSGLKVAVKVASITEMGLEGWRKEVQALQKLHHPNIIRLLGSVYHPHPLTFCLVLEYCDAGDLQDALLRVTPRNFFFHVAASIAKGMAYLHNRSIIHRDIKPSNVLLIGDISSGSYQVKVRKDRSRVVLSSDFRLTPYLLTGDGLWRCHRSRHYSKPNGGDWHVPVDESGGDSARAVQAKRGRLFVRSLAVATRN